MHRTLTTLLLLTTAAWAGESAADLRIYRERYVSTGQPDPAAEFAAALRSSAADWRLDVERARQVEQKLNLSLRTDDALGELRIGHALTRLRKAAGPRSATVHVRIFRAGGVDAFTAGGDRIYVSDTLLRRLNNEELAAVIAHELSHIVARHSFRKRALRRRLKVAAIERALVERLYSRLCEAEADAYATVLLQRAGIKVVTSQFGVFAQLRPDPRRVDTELPRVALQIERLQKNEAQIELAFQQSRSATTFARLARVKQAIADRRAELDRLQRARAFLRLASQHSHPDVYARARFVQSVVAGGSNDPLIRYVTRNARAPR